ncbi:hypothetical protein KCP70_21655 [Salmonella enterica subsp. enterica]|nr:hypothetical protein KCP70_21655 [Salmonella enterica subsp. enterica]
MRRRSGSQTPAANASTGGFSANSEAKAHRVGEDGRSLRNTSPEIADRLLKSLTMTRTGRKIWEEGSDEVLIKAFEKTDRLSLFWGEQSSNVKQYNTKTPPRGACS